VRFVSFHGRESLRPSNREPTQPRRHMPPVDRPAPACSTHGKLFARADARPSSGAARRARPTPPRLQAANPTEYERSEYAGLPVDCAVFAIMLYCTAIRDLERQTCRCVQGRWRRHVRRGGSARPPGCCRHRGHRLSKLLLRQEIVYSGGHPWTGIHEQWLRRQRFDDAHLRAGVRPLFPRRAFAFVDDEENARDGQQPRAPRSHATPTHV
jgi:hypothetical protein